MRTNINEIINNVSNHNLENILKYFAEMKLWGNITIDYNDENKFKIELTDNDLNTEQIIALNKHITKNKIRATRKITLKNGIPVSEKIVLNNINNLSS